MASLPRFSPSTGWDEVRTLLGRESQLLVALAGVFFLLPAAITGVATPDPEPPADATPDFATLLGQMREAMMPNPLLFLVTTLAQLVGQVAIWALILLPQRPTVGEALKAGILLLPFFFLVNLCSNLLVIGGLILLIIPGIYLAMRMTVVGPVFVAENRRWPAGAIGRSFEVTRGNVLPIFAFYAIVMVLFLLIVLVVQSVGGAIFGLAGLDMEFGGTGRALLSILMGVVSATGAVIFTLMPIAIYRQLTRSESETQEVFR